MKTLIAVAAVLSWHTANAGSILLQISGQITTVDPALTSYYSPNTPFSINLSYDPAGSHAGITHLAASGHSLDGIGPIIVQNNAPYDEFILANAPVTGFDIAPYDTPLLYVNFIDNTSSLFNDNSLPNPFPQLSQWDLVIANLGYEDHTANMSRRVNLRVDAVNIVPEPTTGLLLLLPCTLLLFRRNRNAS